MSRNAGNFSLKRNLSTLLSPQPGQLRPVDGLRALSILLVLALHSFWFLTIFDPGAADIFYASPAWLNWIYNGELGVDIFFVISGFLISSLLMKEYQENSRIRFLRFYQRRFMRLMPAYLVAIAVGLVLLPENKEYAWTNLLYINNLMPGETHFMAWTWSLAIEEQFYFLYPLLLVLALRWIRPRHIVYLAALLFLGSLAIRYAVIKHYQLSLPYCWYVNSCEGFYRVIDHIYVKPWTRFGSFLPGIFAAYLHVFHRDRLVQLFDRHRRTISLLTIIAVAVAVAVLFIPVNNQNVVYSDTLGDIYYAVYRNLFTSAVGFVLLSSLYTKIGPGARIAGILSSRGLYPIGQLAYSTYLFHPFVFAIIYAAIFQTAAALPFWGKVAVVVSVGIPATFLIAGLSYLFVERPFMNMRAPARQPISLRSQDNKQLAAESH